MSEEQVTRAVLSWLTAHGWEILDYDFPGGGTGRSFHVGEVAGKNAGIVIPDVIAWKDSSVLVMENKAKDTKSDYDKIHRLSGNEDFLSQLRKTYPTKQMGRILFGIAFSGPPRYLKMASDMGVGLVLRVDEDRTCQVEYAEDLPLVVNGVNGAAQVSDACSRRRHARLSAEAESANPAQPMKRADRIDRGASQARP